ncbi:TetR family transcriptional regulator C-terminal domain-containing protein [Undibacterium sp. RuRC25W]|uniref:TetR family transcriptional regulator C-terminal domain-containing protein n=1 Tax=Undibacterium sp. RuRC25W TaxID=3413047 RepID=UPI003BF1878B
MDKRVETVISPRDQIEAKILQSATEVFSELGFAGASVAGIAERAGISKQNLLYYFANKQVLYHTVLDQVLDQWLERMVILADERQEPEQLLRSYIKEKLRFSREQPHASRVYAMEVISGAQTYAESMREKIIPLLKKDIAVFEQWISQGKIATVNPTHLLFLIWAMTQSYADFSVQMTLVLGHAPLNEGDFSEAEKLISELILHRLQCSQRAASN